MGALCGHAFGVRVQKVLRVQRVLPASSRRVQRVWYRLTAMDLFKCRLSAAALPAAVKRASPVEMHPYRCCAPLLLKGSMSLDSQVVLLPYESSSFATPEGEVCSTLIVVLT